MSKVGAVGLLTAIGAVLAVILIALFLRFISPFVFEDVEIATRNNFEGLASDILLLAETPGDFATRKRSFFIDEDFVVVGFQPKSEQAYSFHTCGEWAETDRDGSFKRGPECGDSACLCLYRFEGGFFGSVEKSSNYVVDSCQSLPVDRIYGVSSKVYESLVGSEEYGYEQDVLQTFMYDMRGKPRSVDLPPFKGGLQSYSDLFIFGDCDDNFGSKPLHIEKIKQDGLTSVTIAGYYLELDERNDVLTGFFSDADDLQRLYDSGDYIATIRLKDLMQKHGEKVSGREDFRRVVYLGASWIRMSEASTSKIKEMTRELGHGQIFENRDYLRSRGKALLDYARAMDCCKDSREWQMINELSEATA